MNQTVYLQLEKKDLPAFRGLCEEGQLDDLTALTVAYGAVRVEDKTARPVGILLGRMEPDSFILDWIYVDEAFRRQGIAAELLGRFMEAVSSIDAVEGVMTVFPGDDAALSSFFLEMDYIVLPFDSSMQYTARVKELIHLPRKASLEKNVYKLSEVSERALKNFGNTLSRSSLTVPVPMPLQAASYSEESLAFVSEDNIKALILLNEDMVRLSDGTRKKCFSITWAYTSATSPAAISILIGVLKQTLTERYGEDMLITMTTINSASAALAEHLFPDVLPVKYLMGTYGF